VDASLNENNPCVNGAVAGANVDDVHSGAIQASIKVVTIPQSVLLSETVIFAVCYAEVNGLSVDATWRDSGIRYMISMLKSIELGTLTIKTGGHIASQAAIQLAYSGSLAETAGLSLVDQTLNGGYPCFSGVVAAATPDVQHTGALSAGAGTKVFAADTYGLSPSVKFALCYTSSASPGVTSAWFDSGLRITVSKISSTLYGVESGRTERTAVSVTTPDDVFPQVVNAKVQYTGDLAAHRWLALVDASLNSNVPCTTGTEAAPTGSHAATQADTTHSGSIRAASSTKEVTVPQTILLSELKTYAVCYAETDGGPTDSTWRDSHIRYKMTKIETLTVDAGSLAATFMFKTTGHLPNIAGLSLTYGGSLTAAKYVSLVDNSLGSGNPCNTGSIAGGSSSSGKSGVKTGSATKVITVDTTALSPILTFAVCYDDDIGDTSIPWKDAGMRFTVAKVTSITYNWPVRMTSAATVATDTLPQVKDQVLTYTGDLANDKWISLVDATLNSANPCVTSSSAGKLLADADSQHSSSIQAASSSKVVTIPQAVLLDETKTFSLCYAETNGGLIDNTWADSYIRLKISKVLSVSSHSVTHRTYGQIASVDDLQLTYAGSLGNNFWISLVDQTLNSNDPCMSGAVSAAPVDMYHSGAIRSGLVNKVVTFDTLTMDTSTIFSVCFTDGDGSTSATWMDSGIRLTTSKVDTLLYGTYSTSYSIRTMSSHNIAAATNRLPQVANKAIFTFVGDIPANKWASLADSSLNSYNPCVDGTVAAATADSTHSGLLTAAAGTKVFTVPQITLLDETKTFAVCYATGHGGTNSSAGWQDTYLRVQMSKLESLSAHLVTHITTGQIARVIDLQLLYMGPIANNKWVSLTDMSGNNDFPCAQKLTYVIGTGYIYLSNDAAPASADATHSGSLTASMRTVVVNTLPLSTAHTFAVCYTETGGTNSASWSDSGVRLTVSKLTAVEYGSPVRTMVSSNLAAATNRLPHGMYAAVFTYTGDLGNAKYVSLVDASLSTGAGGNAYNPCVAGSVAAASVDTTHSGVMQAAANGKIVTVPQSTPGLLGLELVPLLLDSTKEYALCYAESDGSVTDPTWRDSYVRIQMSKMQNISAHTVTHTTSGQIARVGDPTKYINAAQTQSEIDELDLTYMGTLAVLKWISLIDETLDANFPCASGDVAAASADSQHSGVQQSSCIDCATGVPDNSVVSFNTLGLSTSKVFAVCYTEAGGDAAATWIDSGIRLTISKITTLTYSEIDTSSSFPKRTFTSRNVMRAINRLPQGENQAVFTYTGDLAADMWISIVDSTLNSYNPCMDGLVSAALADSTHSGVLQPASGTKVVTLPQLTLLNTEKPFALCYAETSGAVHDTSWRDSYVRVKFSKVQALSSHLKSHKTNGQIATLPSNFQYTAQGVTTGTLTQLLTYSGTLAHNKYIALVDQTLNSDFPCASAHIPKTVLDPAHSGVLQADSSTSTTAIDTRLLGTDKTFAVCYTESVADPASAFHQSTLFIDNPVTSAATMIQFTFSLNKAFEASDSITIVLPGFTFNTLSSPNYSGCGSTSFTTSTANSGTATAAITLIAATTQLVAVTQCTIQIMTGVVTSAATQVENYSGRTVAATIGAHEDISPTPLLTSTAVVAPALIRHSTLYVSRPHIQEATSIAFTFTCNSHIYVNDVISLVLPTWTWGTLPSTTTQGCGTTTFAASSSGSTTATATLSLTATTATLEAHVQCTITVASGITTSGLPQAENDEIRTVGVTLQGSDDIAPTSIIISSEVNHPDTTSTSKPNPNHNL